MSTPDSQRVGPGRVVTLHYTMSCQDEEIERSTPAEPLVYLHGSGTIVPGLEQALEGRLAGERLDLTLPPEQAFGLADPARVDEVPRSSFPAEMELEVGMQLGAENERGDEMAIWITDIQGELITVNANHPLAGETLRFRVEVLEVREATPAELEHRHHHGPDDEH